MARLPTRDFQPVGLEDWIEDGPRYYNDSDMRRVLHVVARHLSYEAEDIGPSNTGEYARLYVDLQKALNSGAALFRMASNREAKPTPSTLIKDFEKIEIAAHRLLGALHTPTGELDELPALLRWEGGLESGAVHQMAMQDAASRIYGAPAGVRGIGALRDALRGVRLIREWAEQSRKLNEKLREHDAAAQNRPALEIMGPEDRFIYNLTGTWREVLGRVDIASSEFRNFAYEAMRVPVVDPDVTIDAIRGRVERLQQRIREYDAMHSINPE